MKYIQPFNVVASGISCENQKCIYKFSMDEQKTAAVQPQSRIAILYTSFSKKQNSQFQKNQAHLSDRRPFSYVRGKI